jgi:tight adherence protein C
MLIRGGEPMTLTTFLVVWLITVLLGAAAAYVAVLRLDSLGALRLIVAGLFLFYSLLLPYLLMRRRAVRRTRRIERELPDALDLMLTCVEAGLGVDAAFALVAERSRGPLAESFREYLKQVGLGRSRRDALEDIATRSGAQGLNRLAVTVTQSTAVGTSMGDVLRIQAAELREARRLRAQEAAARAPILMTVPLALCFMPAMIAVVVVPSIFNLIEFVGGGFGTQ